MKSTLACVSFLLALIGGSATADVQDSYTLCGMETCLGLSEKGEGETFSLGVAPVQVMALAEQRMAHPEGPGLAAAPTALGRWGVEENTDLRGLHFRLGLDLRDLFLTPARMDKRQWMKFGGAVLLVGGVSLLDEDIRDAFGGGSGGEQQVARTVRPIGQEGGLGFLGVSWLLGKALHRPKWQAIGRDGLEATLLSAGLITPVIKSISGRSRPNRGEGSTSFGGGHSFPSGEVTQVFAIASVVAAHSERKWVRWLAWSLAGLTAWQRMELDAHWGSDTVAGALIGATVGRWVVRRNRPRFDRERRWSVSPQVGNGSYGVGFRLTLGPSGGGSD